MLKVSGHVTSYELHVVRITFGKNWFSSIVIIVIISKRLNHSTHSENLSIFQ